MPTTSRPAPFATLRLAVNGSLGTHDGRLELRLAPVPVTPGDPPPATSQGAQIIFYPEPGPGQEPPRGRRVRVEYYLED